MPDDPFAIAEHLCARFHAGDVNAVRGPRVAALARELLARSQVETPEGPGLVVPAVQLAATLYWCRCAAAEQGGHEPDREDEAALWTLVDTLRGIDPALVPFPVPERPADHWDLMDAGRQVLNQATATLPFDRDGVRRAADLMRQAVTLAEGTPDHPTMLGSYGATMIDVFQAGGDPRDIDAAIAAIRAALTTLPATHPMHVHLRAGLGGALVRRHDHGGDPADLAEAEVVLRAVLPDYPPGTDPTPSYADLASALNARARTTGDPADLGAAVGAVRDAVARIPAEHPSYPGFHQMLGRLLWRLGVAHWDRYTVDADLAYGNRAVDTIREALATLAFDDEERLDATIVLGNTLAARGRQLGSSSDILEATRCFQAALAQAHEETRRHEAMTSLAKALLELAIATGQLDTFARAEAVFRELLAADVPAYQRLDATVGLGALLSMRCVFTGNFAELDESVTLLRSALGDLEPGASLNLADALKKRYDVRRDPADLDEAIAVLDALAPGLSAPPRAVLTLHLADLHVRRGHHDLAYRTYLEAAEGGAVHPSYRVLAARNAAELATRERRFDDALAAYTLAVELLPLNAWGGLERADQQRYVADFTGLAGDAAAAALSAGQPETAVELLEQGRAVLWARVLQTRGAGALDGLPPDLAAELARVWAAMRTQPAGQPDGGLPAEIATAQERMVHAHREQELLARVRALPGHENFLRRKSFTELRVAASDGPVVMVNLTAHRCDALVVQPTGVQVVELDVSLDDAVTRAQVLLSLRPGDSLASFVDAQASLVDVLAWLWDAVVEPVLAVVPEASRVWWCAAGFATLFPLHVAGRHGDVSAMDRVVSSYTTTLSALVRARQHPPAADVRRLVVGVADAPGTPQLSNVDEEVRLVGGDTALVGPAATAERVLAELARHPWAHIACHGYQNVADPSGSHLAMHDRPLTVQEIAALDLPAAELAFLSACETSAPGLLAPDEAISVAAALQLAGYRHVIATLWTIPDRSAVAGSVYRDGLPAEPARALHDAIRAAMAANPYEPTSWAPYQHLGP